MPKALIELLLDILMVLARWTAVLTCLATFLYTTIAIMAGLDGFAGHTLQQWQLFGGVVIVSCLGVLAASGYLLDILSPNDERATEGKGRA